MANYPSITDRTPNDQIILDYIYQALSGGAVGNSPVHQEDSAHTSGDYGNFMLAVRNDGLATLTSADFDYSPISVTSKGQVLVKEENSALIYNVLSGWNSTTALKSVGITEKVFTTPTISVSPAYSIGDNVGGSNTAALIRVSGGTCTLEDLVLYDGGNAKPSLTILLFTGAPSGTYTDNSAQVIAGDQGKLIGKINVGTGDWETIGAVAVAHIKGINNTLKAVSGTNVYYAIMTNTIFTGASTSQFTLGWGVFQD